MALFPTDVQTALGFLIQAPYELTPSREGLDGGKKARDTNQRLIKETAKLVPVALAKLKELGLLTISALDALPLDAEAFETDLGKFFAPVCEALKFLTPRSERLKQAGLPSEDIRWLELKERDPQAAAEFLRNYRRRSVLPSIAANEQVAVIAPRAVGGGANRASERDQLTDANAVARVQEPGSVEVSAISATQPTAKPGESGPESSVAEKQADGPASTYHLETRVRVVAAVADETIGESPELLASRTRVDRAGIAKVKAFEEAAGRIVQELPHNNPGYDLHARECSSSEIVRFIEVKSTGSDWTGVLLSSTQFQEALRLGEQYWLYVVENADLPEAKVFPIQNPAGLSEKFIFDAGWKHISVSQQIGT